MRLRLGLVASFSLLQLLTIPAQPASEPSPWAGNDVLAHRVWHFLDSDWDYLQRAIPKAREAGMNRIQLGQKIINNVHELYRFPEKLELVRNATSLAHAHDLKVDIWTHELADVPNSLKKDGRIVMNDALWSWMRDKYERVFRLVPDVDGLVLTFAESQANVYSDRVISALPPEARIAKVIEVMADVCRKHGKMLTIRTFVYTDEEVESMRRAVAAIADAVGKNGNVVVMTKCVPFDWSPFYPFNPTLGKTSGLPEIVEIDLGEEYSGLSHILHCQVAYVQTILAHARGKKVVGAVARVDRDRGNRALESPNEVNLHAFSRLTHDASPTVDALWTEWARKRYGESAARYATDALKGTYDVSNMTLYALEHSMQNHSRLPGWDYALSHITLATPFRCVPTPRQKLAFDELLRPDWITLIKIDAEKDAARRLAEGSLEILKKGRAHFRREDYAQLRRFLEFDRDVVEVFRYQNLSFASTLRYLNRVKGISAEHETPAEMRAVALRYLDQFDRSADVIQRRYGPEAYPGNPARAHRSTPPKCDD